MIHCYETDIFLIAENDSKSMLVGFKRNGKKREDVFYTNVTVNAANSIHPPKLENIDLSKMVRLQ